MNKNKIPQKRRPIRKKPFSLFNITLTIVIVLVILTVVTAVSFLKNHQPSLDTDIPFDTRIDPEVTVDPDNSPTTDDTTAANPVNPFIRNTDTVNFLIVGRDATSWNTDVIMLVNFNMKNGSLSLMQLPRDTYIEVGQSRSRINTTLKNMRNYAYKNDPSLSSEALLKAGLQGMCELLEKNLCIQIDGYAHIDLEGFRGLVDAIGGVYMDVPYDMEYEDPVQGLYIDLKAGYQRLDGKKAEMFVRFREGYVQADIGRIDAQKIFMTTLFKQLKTNLTVSTVPKIVEQLIKYVTTDVPITDMVIYAKELLGVDMSNVSMMTLHGSAMQTESGAWFYVMNRAATLDMINSYFNVYNTPIPDSIFDKAQAFTDETSSRFNRIYLADPTSSSVEVKPDIQTGEDIDKGELDIMIKQ